MFSFFPGKSALGQSTPLLEMGDSTEAFFFFCVAQVLPSAPAAGHNLIRKIAMNLATALCLKASRLSASACQRGDTPSLPRALVTSYRLSATAPQPLQTVLTAILHLQTDRRSPTVTAPVLQHRGSACNDFGMQCLHEPFFHSFTVQAEQDPCGQALSCTHLHAAEFSLSAASHHTGIAPHVNTDVSTVCPNILIGVPSWETHAAIP